jgi:putative SOS response-associated peptidase YedK
MMDKDLPREDVEQWLTAMRNDALALQRPCPGDALRIVARGKKEDGPDRD